MATAAYIPSCKMDELNDGRIKVRCACMPAIEYCCYRRFHVCEAKKTYTTYKVVCSRCWPLGGQARPSYLQSVVRACTVGAYILLCMWCENIMVVLQAKEAHKVVAFLVLLDRCLLFCQFNEHKVTCLNLYVPPVQNRGLLPVCLPTSHQSICTVNHH